MSSEHRLNRRRFLVAAALASACAICHRWPPRGRKCRSQRRFTLGFIGMGKQSRGHLQWALNNPRTQVVAVCDVHDLRLQDAVAAVGKKYGEKSKSGSDAACAAYRDFRELLARGDIDGVVVSTPDHWHAIPSILAARAKKHVYCEKPLSLTIAESRAMVDAARENGIVFQTGSQQRTEFNGYFRTAVEYIRSGRIGRVKTVRVGVGGPAKPCDLPVEPTPQGVDWDLWNGPAPERGFNHVLCPLNVHDHFPAFRLYREYAGGMLADMGAHHFDIAQWVLDQERSGPVEIQPLHKVKRGCSSLRQRRGDVHGGPSGCTFEARTERSMSIEGIESRHRRSWKRRWRTGLSR
jgi:predicted dehydrogenase